MADMTHLPTLRRSRRIVCFSHAFTHLSLQSRGEVFSHATTSFDILAAAGRSSD